MFFTELSLLVGYTLTKTFSHNWNESCLFHFLLSKKYCNNWCFDEFS